MSLGGLIWCGFTRPWAEAVQRYLAGFTVMLQQQVHAVIDLKELVVRAMCEDKNSIVELFQRCGRDELKFLVDSGLWWGGAG